MRSRVGRKTWFLDTVVQHMVGSSNTERRMSILKHSILVAGKDKTDSLPLQSFPQHAYLHSYQATRVYRLA